MRVAPPEAQSLVQSLAIVLVKSLVLGLARPLALATTQPIFAVAASRRPIAVVWLPYPQALN